MEDRKEIYKLYFALVAFILGMGMLAGLIWIPVPQQNQSMANIAIGFVTATVIAIPIAYVLGGNPSSKKGDSTIPVTGQNPVVNVAQPTEQPVNVNTPPAQS